MFVMIKGKVTSALGQEMHCRCDIEKDVVSWCVFYLFRLMGWTVLIIARLGLTAFVRVLKKKQTQFRLVIKALDLRLRLLRIGSRKLETLKSAISSESCVGFDYIIY